MYQTKAVRPDRARELVGYLQSSTGSVSGGPVMRSFQAGQPSVTSPPSRSGQSSNADQGACDN